MGQYGIRNPTFMYQGTEGLSIRVGVSCPLAVKSTLTATEAAGTKRSAADRQNPDCEMTKGFSIIPDIRLGADLEGDVSTVVGAGSGVRCGEN